MSSSWRTRTSLRVGVAGSCAMIAVVGLACANLADLSAYTLAPAQDGGSTPVASLDAAPDTDAGDASCRAATEGLLAHFTMDTDSLLGSGLFVADSSGQQHSGTLEGFPNPPVMPPGRLGQALQFPSTSPPASVDVPGLPLNTSLGDVTTVSLWFLSPDAPDGSVSQVLTFLPPAQDNLWLNGNEPSAVNLCFNTKANDCWGLAGASVVGSWVHAVAMFATGQLSTSQLFINGQPIGATCLSGACTNAVSAATSVDLGGFGQFGYDGLLDEVRIYDRALTATEVEELYELCP